MLFVSRLCSFFSLGFLVFLFCFWFNDVGRGRFGGVARVFFEDGDFGFESSDFFECGFEQSFELGDSFVFGIHERHDNLLPNN